jgi:hypothetical protein
MPYRINHIDLEAADPRTTFRDRVVRCQSEDGTISGGCC